MGYGQKAFYYPALVDIERSVLEQQQKNHTDEHKREER